jgi:16S rRNA (uracil1498-N3)-methyltransferase
MRLSRLFVDRPLATGQTVVLPADRAHYVTRVLRARVGDALVVFDGRGGEHRATLERATRQEVAIAVGEHLERDVESPLAVTLALGISRGERMDLALQKATELGVAAVRPLFTERTVVDLAGERLQRRMAHWRGVLTAACEQSGRTRLPGLHPPASLSQHLSAHAETAVPHTGLLLDPQAATGPTALPRPEGPVTLLIGPEGGLSDAERAAAYHAGYRGLRLGPRVLRTETAPLAALAILQALWGDLG